MSPPALLAVDLDGTLLHGSDGARAELRAQTAAGALEVVFVTGRRLADVRPLLDDPGLPEPRYVIADHGATVVQVSQSLQPLRAAAQTLDARALAQALRPFPGVRHDPVLSSARRGAFVLEPEAPEAAVVAALTAQGWSVVHTPGRWLDVLPPGVDKGRSLRRLLAEASLEDREVIAAGDQLPDLSMMEAAALAVIVANASEALRTAARRLRAAFFARSEGADGIVEALRTAR
ncbi:MAG: HAD hydrolase family protein [Alphaproteobacteria bacterium]|nr:HAD hydrolase family protein [Alphaproteobacteria bacterium]